MKPTPTSPTEFLPLLAFGAHPDDVEFGCGGVIAKETRAGRTAHIIVCSRGEAASHGTVEERTHETKKGAAALGANVDFLELDGDAHLEIRTGHVIKIAEIIRRVRPEILLAPSLQGNQHPDHYKLGQMVRDAARVARYGGVAELKGLPAHAIHQLFFYDVTCDANESVAVFVDVSEVVTVWTEAMESHASQLQTRNYVELQLARARVNGLRAGVGHAIALYPNDPLVVDSLAQLGRGARTF